MNKKLEDKLKNKYKFLKRKIKAPYSYVLFGIECGDGWYKLLDGLCGKIEKELSKDGKLAKKFYVTQIKEKFAGLRFYTSYGNDKVFDLINEAENDSFNICENCGKPAKHQTVKGWMLTLCKACLEKHKQERKQLL